MEIHVFCSPCRVSLNGKTKGYEHHMSSQKQNSTFGKKTNGCVIGGKQKEVYSVLLMQGVFDKLYNGSHTKLSELQPKLCRINTWAKHIASEFIRLYSRTSRNVTSMFANVPIKYKLYFL